MINIKFMLGLIMSVVGIAVVIIDNNAYIATGITLMIWGWDLIFNHSKRRGDFEGMDEQGLYDLYSGIKMINKTQQNVDKSYNTPYRQRPTKINNEKIISALRRIKSDAIRRLFGGL